MLIDFSRHIRFVTCLFFNIHFIFVLNSCFDIDPLETDNSICPIPFASAYNRDEHFGGWIDEDGDGEDTRWEVLVEENIGDSTFVFSNNHKFFGNPIWISPYSGLSNTDPDTLDIDHLVPLKEAWISGACFWEQEKRVRFNNFLADPHHLMAVEASLNRQKSDSDPVHWLPPNLSFQKNYFLYWAQIKANWGLTVDEEEYSLLQQKLGSQFPSILKTTTCGCQ